MTFSCGVDGVAYNTRLDFTVNAIDLALVILTAIDKDKFDSITFYDLMNQTGACVADMFVDGGFKISSVFADISSMTDPVLTGIGDVDLQNLMNTAVEILFDMYVVFEREAREIYYFTRILHYITHSHHCILEIYEYRLYHSRISLNVTQNSNTNARTQVRTLAFLEITVNCGLLHQEHHRDCNSRYDGSISTRDL